MAGQLTQDMVAIAPERFGSPQAYGFGANGVFRRGTDLYIVCDNPAFGQNSWANANVDTDPPPVLAQARVLKSLDAGATWAEVDVDNGPQVSIFKLDNFGTFRGLTSPMAATYQDADTILVGYYFWDYTYGNAPELRFSVFDMSTDSWGAETTGGPTASTQQNNQPQLNLSIAYRAGDGALVFLFDGYEDVGGLNFCRMFYSVYNAGWGAAVPIDVAQAGSTDDYRMAGAVAGDADRTHLFYMTNIGSINLLQATLDSSDTLQAAVAITSAVDTNITRVPPFGAQWGFAASRSAAGVTTLYIPYVKDASVDLTFQWAISANTPAFTEVTVGGTNCAMAGISNCGPIDNSRGLAAVTQENINDPGVTGSQDVNTWEAITPLTIPADPAFGEIGQYLGLGIIQGGGGLYSAGYVANSFYFPPD